MANLRTVIIFLFIGSILGASIGYFVSPKQTDTSDLEQQISDLQVQKDLLTAQINEKETQIESLQSQSNTLQNQLNDKENETTDLEDQISTLESQIITLEGQVSTLQSQTTEKNTKISELESSITTLQQSIDILEAMVPPLPPEDGENGSSRFFPADIGDNLACIFEDLFEEYTATITVKEIIRGDTAWNMIEDANMFNDPPLAGFEYILVKINFEYVSGPTIDSLYHVSSFDFDVISEDGYEYDSPATVEPEPDLSANLYPGASHEGWAAYQISETDTSPVLTFGRDFTGSGGVWFKLY